MSKTDLGPLLAAVGTDYERGRTIAERASIDPRTAGMRLKSLLRDGLVESKYTQAHGGVRLYRRTPAAPPLPTELTRVDHEHGVWTVRVGVLDGVVGMSAGAWNSHEADGSTHGVLVNVPDAAALRSLIGDLGRALDQIEGRS